MESTAGSQKTELVYAFAKRADGSVRQMIIQDDLGNLYGMGYFKEGTSIDDAKALKDIQYHWAASFSNRELINSYNLSEEEISQLRTEIVIANDLKEFTHRST